VHTQEAARHGHQVKTVMMMISMRLRINYEMCFNERPEYLTRSLFDYPKSRALALFRAVAVKPVRLVSANNEREIAKTKTRADHVVISLQSWSSYDFTPELIKLWFHSRADQVVISLLSWSSGDYTPELIKLWFHSRADQSAKITPNQNQHLISVSFHSRAGSLTPECKPTLLQNHPAVPSLSSTGSSW
jgi:hypothetical protein